MDVDDIAVLVETKLFLGGRSLHGVLGGKDFIEFLKL
jgi:hypothetical protein